MKTIMDRGLLILGFVTAAGIALVGAGWAIQGSAYLPGLLMQLGTSMMLLVPLALLGFMLENRMRRTEEQLQATADKLDTLTAITRDRLAASQRQRDEMFGRARRAPTQDIVRALLGDASQIGAINSSGTRVRLPGASLRIRFELKDDNLQVHVEESDGTILDQLAWNERESAEIFAQRLAEHLKALDRYPGDSLFDPAAMIRQLLDTLQAGVNARTGEHHHDLGHLIEIPNQQWAVSAEGLFSLQHHYHIPVQRITNSHEDWPRHMRTLAWVDKVSFDEAYTLARKLLNRT